MRQFDFIRIGLVLCALLWSGTVQAETFQLNDGRTVTGELLPNSADDSGLQVRLEDNSYERIPWTSFTQEDIRKFARDDRNPKLARQAAQFIELTPEERRARSKIPPLQNPPRLERPPAHSLVGAMFSSSVGLFVLLLLYGANIYAGYEVAIFRAQPVPLVCGVSAVLPLIGPIIFLSMPTRIAPEEEEALNAPPPEAPAFNVGGRPPAPGTAPVGPVASAAPSPRASSAPAGSADPTPEAAAEPAAGGLRLHHEQPAAASSLPEAQTFQRGAFTFNRRFFETKFPGFFGVVKREADKDMVLFIKAARGEYVGQRITRIAANDLHIQVQKGSASEEVMIPFSEIQMIQLKHKDA